MDFDINLMYIYKAIDLFAGIGGIRLGFEQAFRDQIKFVFSCEIDEFCCLTYKLNFGENPKADIKEVITKDIPDFDILLAGFPCQAFSIAGYREGFNDERGNLFFYIRDIIREKKPLCFLLENVKHLKNHDKSRTFNTIEDILRNELGYTIYYTILDASLFRLPQKRKRIYIVGFREDIKFKFPEGENRNVRIGNILEKDVNTKYFLSQQYLNTLKNHRTRHKAKGHGFGYQVIGRKEVANTIVCGGMGKERNLVKDTIKYDAWRPGDDPLKKKNNEGIRKMTEREWARLQGFPDSFIFPVSMTQAYKQLANSVPVPVIKAIAIEMKQSLERFYANNAHIAEFKKAMIQE